MPAEPGELATNRRRQLTKPRGIVVLSLGLIALVCVMIAATSLVQATLPAYTPESVAAAVAETRGAEFASCDQDDGVEGSWTCQLGHTSDAADCDITLQSGTTMREVALAADTYDYAASSECVVSELETTKETTGRAEPPGSCHERNSR